MKTWAPSTLLAYVGGGGECHLTDVGGGEGHELRIEHGIGGVH